MQRLTSDSTFVQHEPCPACRAKGDDASGNNLARYSDGHGYCNACGYYQAPDGEGHQAAEPKEKPAFEPIDFDIVPLKARGIDTKPAPSSTTASVSSARNASGAMWQTTMTPRET